MITCGGSSFVDSSSSRSFFEGTFRAAGSFSVAGDSDVYTSSRTSPGARPSSCQVIFPSTALAAGVTPRGPGEAEHAGDGPGVAVLDADRPDGGGAVHDQQRHPAAFAVP